MHTYNADAHVCFDRKELLSDLQLRDALMAKIVFHNIRMEEVTNNLQETKKEVILNLRYIWLI